MPRFSRDRLEKMLSLRLTREQEHLLGDLAAALGLAGGRPGSRSAKSSPR